MNLTKEKRSWSEVIKLKSSRNKLEFYNPMNVEQNSTIILHIAGYEKYRFKIIGIREYICKNDNKFIDYELIDKLNEPFHITIRIKDDKAYVLKLEATEEYNNDLIKVIEESQRTGKWIVKLNDKNYTILHYLGNNNSYIAKSYLIKNDNRFDGAIYDNELKCLEFVRTYKNEINVEENDYYFIEMDDENKIVYIRNGINVRQCAIDVL